MTSQNYIQHIVEQLNVVTAKCGPIQIFGENINYGSCIGGLARGLTVNDQGRIFNVGNCELTHVGVGLGVLLDGGQAALFGKQLDFIVLGLEQACDTFNFIRAYRDKSTWGSFTIFVIVCDQGYQGPQSSMNAAGDFASLANIPVYCLNAKADVEQVVGHHFASPGFRIICVSQQFFTAAPMAEPAQWVAADQSLFRYATGDDVTIVSFNFSLRKAMHLAGQLAAAGAASDLFLANFVPGMDLEPVLASLKKTRRLILLDDSKTVTKSGDAIVTIARMQKIAFEVLSLCRRGCPDRDYGVNADEFSFEVEPVLAFIRDAPAGIPR